jgi:hypothetical protein
MRKLVIRTATGVLLVLVALVPLRPATGEELSLPQACEQLAFSTEEDFITRGPEPADGNPYISDGDLLSLDCVICARNRDLVQNLDVADDLGLDAADVIDSAASLVVFSTELDSPNRGQFTAGDLLTTDGAIIPNVALTHGFPVGYDIGLDALHFVGEKRAILAFLDEIQQYRRDDWLEDPGKLAEILGQYEIDIWFSTEGTWTPVGAVGFLDGDVLSVRNGAVVAHIEDLLPGGVPAGIPDRGVDFGLDAVTADRRGDKEAIRFSTEILYEDEFSFTDGDVLLAGNGVSHVNQDLVKCFEPQAGFLGLDAFHWMAAELQPGVYLPVVLRALEATPQ